MNLVELYTQIPVERHGDIKVVGERFFVKDIDGNVEEYFIDERDGLWLVCSDRQQKEALSAIKSKLGIRETLK